MNFIPYFHRIQTHIYVCVCVCVCITPPIKLITHLAFTKANYIYTITHPWRNGHYTSISACRVWESKERDSSL